MLNLGHRLETRSSLPAAGLMAINGFLSDSSVPLLHPLRRVKQLSDCVLGTISSELDELSSAVDRPWIAPERLLKGQLLIALYSIRSDRQFCQQLGGNLLYRWFLDMDMESTGLDPWNFRHLRKRVVAAPQSRRFFDEVLTCASREQLLFSTDFNVNHGLIEALCYRRIDSRVA